MAEKATPLRTLVTAFQGLVDGVSSSGVNPRIEISQLVLVMRLGCQFILCFGNELQFAMLELQEKADKLENASKSSNTVQALVELDINENRARVNSSYSRYLVRTKRSMDFLRVFFQQILSTSGNSLVGPLTTAYTQVFSPYHGSAVKAAFLASVEDIMSKDQLFKLFNEDEDSAKDLMRKYTVGADVVMQHIDSIFKSTEIGKELLRMV